MAPYPADLRPNEVRFSSWTFLAALVVTVLMAGCDAPPPRETLQSEIATELLEERLAEAASLGVVDAYEQALEEDDAFLKHMLLASAYARVDAETLPAVSDVFLFDAAARNAREASVLGALWGRVDPARGLVEVTAWDRPLVQIYGTEALFRAAIEERGPGAAVAALENLAEQEAGAPLLGTRKKLIEELFAAQAYEMGLVQVEAMDLDAETRPRIITLAVVAAGRGAGVGEAPPLYSWIERQLNESDGQREVLNEFATYLLAAILGASSDAGLEWYEKHVAGTAGTEKALALIGGSEWGRQNPDEALAYLRSRPEDEPIELGLRALAYVWLKEDGKTARQRLIAAADEDPRLVGLLFPVAQYLIPRELETSLLLAQRIPNEQEKHAILEQGLMKWARQDPAGVDEFIARYPIDSDLRRSVTAAKSLAGAGRKAGSPTSPEEGSNP